MNISPSNSTSGDVALATASNQHLGTPEVTGAASVATPSAENVRGRASRRLNKQQLLEIIAAQKNQPTLQVFENLARTNHQAGAVAAVLAAEANKTNESQPARWRLPFRSHVVPDGYVETGIRSIVRHREVAATGDPLFKTNESRKILKRTDRHSAESIRFATSTKSEMLVERLLHVYGNNANNNAGIRITITPGVDADLNQALLKAGVAAVDIQDGQVTAMAGQTTPPMDAALLATLVAERSPNMQHVDFIRQLTGYGSEAAQFFNYIEHALLLKNSANNKPCNRYEYTDEVSLLSEQVQNKGEPWLETFLPGVERDLMAQPDSEQSWRILDHDQWRYPETKKEVLDHVFFSAMDHLQQAAPTGSQMPIYPLVAYELLASAIGKPVPDYLIAHEENILLTLADNKDELQARKTRQREESIQAQASRARAIESQQQRIRDQHVNSAIQLSFCNNSYDRHKITESSIDRMLPLTALDGNTLALTRNIQAKLNTTHDRQTVSYTDPTTPRRDNLCWLRSAWLSLFCTQTPDQLAQRLQSICRPDSRALASVPVLAEIAQHFHASPGNFMHGGNADQTLTGNLAQAARLGPPGPIEALIPAAARPATSRLPPRTLEEWLQNLQCDLAANFRFEDKKIMNEVEAVGFPGAFASSDMLICLHRAFQAPCLIVEAGLSETGGDQHSWSSVSAQLRVAAVKDTALAELLAAPPEEMPASALDRAAKVFGEFTHLPVIWLEREHFEVYFPKSMTRDDVVT